MEKFDYVLDRIRNAPMRTEPFKHLYLEDLLAPHDFDAVITAAEINQPMAANDTELFDHLFASGYKIIDFPGCITDRRRYIQWHANPQRHSDIHSTCEGFGVTLRLQKPSSPILIQLSQFLAGRPFNATIAEKFCIDLDDTFIDNGIQKYLDGYEISPHPDIRKKALTYMVNINPHANADELDHHTHYLKFKPAYDYVRTFWQGNATIDRCWIPWTWCETQFTQTKNNSIVIFAPGNDTIHAVRAAYDHLRGQRTQLYGNLWFKRDEALSRREWEDLAIAERMPTRTTKQPPSLSASIRKLLGPRVIAALRRRGSVQSDSHVISDRVGDAARNGGAN